VLGGGKASLREDDVISEPTEVMKPSSHAKGMERRQPHQRKMVRQQIQLGRQSVPGR